MPPPFSSSSPCLTLIPDLCLYCRAPYRRAWGGLVGVSVPGPYSKDSLFHTSHILQLPGSSDSHRMFLGVLHSGTLLDLQLACWFQLIPPVRTPVPSAPSPTTAASSPGDCGGRIVDIKHRVFNLGRVVNNFWGCINCRNLFLIRCYNRHTHK